MTDETAPKTDGQGWSLQESEARPPQRETPVEYIQFGLVSGKKGLSILLLSMIEQLTWTIEKCEKQDVDESVVRNLKHVRGTMTKIRMDLADRPREETR
jgi:hypothetical protein